MRGVSTFQRARSAEQRAQRSQAILEVAEAMLAEMPLADISLNELSRRVGLAKSNVLHYFESREAVLLELVHAATRKWLDDLAQELDDLVDAAADATARIAQFAYAFAASLDRHPLFCELISAQAGVLERNISTETAVKFKRTLNADQARLAALVTGVMPELDTRAAVVFATGAVIMAGALWIHARPTPAVLAAFEADPEIRGIYSSFAEAVRDTTHTLLAGSISRTQPGKP
jgi:AcrR family transcriptional regulator